MLGLPSQTVFNRVVPKNSFYQGLKARQKQDFVDLVERIRWQHKLAQETINLPGVEWEEIQVFTIELKRQSNIDKLLEIIDKLIPYLIIFQVNFEDQCYLSAAIKHRHPTDEARTVIDARFSTDWMAKDHSAEYKLDLKRNLDYVFSDFCQQLGKIERKPAQELSGQALAEYQNKKAKLEREIEQLKKKIKKCKQFNIRVELNMEKKAKEEELGQLE